MSKSRVGTHAGMGAGKIVSGQELAMILGVSRNTIQSYRSNGMPIADNNGTRGSARYNTVSCLDWLSKRKLDRIAETDDYALDIEEIRRRTELAKMKQAEIELAVTEERYGDIEAILGELSNALTTIRANLIALPKIAPQLEHTDSDLIEKRLEDEIYRVLTELSDFTIDDAEDVANE